MPFLEVTEFTVRYQKSMRSAYVINKKGNQQTPKIWQRTMNSVWLRLKIKHPFFFPRSMAYIILSSFFLFLSVNFFN
jgi:hypothetical protein